MAQQVPDSFLDVSRLLESSAPRPRGSWFWYIAGILLLILMLGSYFSSRYEQSQRLIEGLSMFLLIGMILAMWAMTWSAARSVQREHAHLQAIEELIQLRRWDQAAATLQSLLSRPARTPQAHVQSLLFLAAVLARYHRFGDAIAVYDHILSTVQLDEDGTFGIKLARAMAQLRDDRLFDADRAINELRRLCGADDSAALALIEIYRDVKTGHPLEAADMFQKKHPVLTRQLGHRMADALALAARAHDLLGHADEAQALYGDATLLVAEPELTRRYPELQPLAGKYPAASAPGEAA